MTLATTVHITDPINPELVFLKAREIIGIPAEHPFRIHEPGRGFTDGKWIDSEPGGFRSALDVSHNDGKPLGPGVYADEDLDREPPAYVAVRLDTTYGYTGHPEGCSGLHREITAKLGEWLDAQGVGWWAFDEFWGDWHERTPCPVEGRR